MPQLRFRKALLAALLPISLPATADISINDQLSFYGDVRGGYFNLRRAERNGGIDKNDDWRVRVRAGLKADLGSGWSGAVRFSGRYSTDQDGTRFSIDGEATTPTGLTFGESTLDELYLAYTGETLGTVRVGRFQTRALLPGVAVKSLSRNDSLNTEITWTDGVQWQHQFDHGWRSQVIIEYNSPNGSSNSKRPPLGFDKGASRWSGFAGIENTTALGPLVHRAIDVTWLPEALYTRGTDQRRTEDYVAVVGRLAAKWPIGDSGTAFMLAGEAGYAPDTPRTAAVVSGRSGSADGHAWQVSFNLLDFIPDHSMAVVVGEAGAGYLISPDFVPNYDLLELRYQWKVDRNQRIEARIRQREELKRQATAQRTRTDTDFYVRYTYSF